MKNFLLPLFTLICVVSFAQTDSAQYYSALGKQAFTEKKYLQAEKFYTKSLQFDAKNIDVQLDLAQSFFEMKKYANAIKQYKTVNTLVPSNVIALEKLATLSFMSRQWVDAVNYGKMCIDKKIGTKMNYTVAKSYYEQEEYVESSKYLEAASKDDPSNAEVPYLMANIWLEMNQPKKALEMYKIALTKDSTKASWFYEVATLYNDLGDPKSALPYYEKAVANGMNSDLNFNTTLGLAYLNSGQYEKGIAIMDKVVAKKPMDKTIYDDIGYAFYNAKKYDDAIQWWDKILKIDKQDARALYMIGIAFQKKGDNEKGSRLCDAAIALDPKLGSLKKEMAPPQGMGL